MVNQESTSIIAPNFIFKEKLLPNIQRLVLKVYYKQFEETVSVSIFLSRKMRLGG